MSTTTPTEPSTPPPVDPWLARLKGSLQEAVAPDPAATDATPETVTLSNTGAANIAEQAVLITRQAEAAAKAETKATEAPKKEEATTTPAEPTKPADPAPAKADEVTPPQDPEPAKVKVNRQKVAIVPLPEVQTPPTQPVQQPQQQAQIPAQEQPKPSADDEALIASLTDEERDEYELAVYAAKSNPTHANKPAEVLSFFKKVQQFTASNPDSQPDSPEFQKLIDTTRPRWAPGEKRKLSRKMIEDAVLARAKDEIGGDVKAELEQTKAKLKEIEKSPEVSKRVAEFKQSALVKVPEGYSRIDQEVIEAASTLSTSELLERFPVEGSVLVKHFDAVTELERIKEGMVPFTPTNQTHAFLLSFLNQQEQYLASAPETIKRDPNGRVWVSRMQMEQLLAKDPSAHQKYWFIDNEMLKSQLAVHAHEEVGNRIEQFKKAGFERRQPAKTATQQPQPPATPPPAKQVAPEPAKPQPDNPHAGPKASVSTAPVLETVTRKPTEAEMFIKSRIPGYKLG